MERNGQMRTIILYYTFGGSTKKEAERLAAELGASVYRVKELHERGLWGAFMPGGLMAMHRRKSAVQPLQIDLDQYERILIGCPVWAGHPAPAFNAIVELLPAGKSIELFFCSAGGDSSQSRPGTEELIKSKGCTLLSYRDIRTDAPPKKIKE